MMIEGNGAKVTIEIASNGVISFYQLLADIEDALMISALNDAKTITGASVLLSLRRTTLMAKLKKHGIILTKDSEGNLKAVTDRETKGAIHG